MSNDATTRAARAIMGQAAVLKATLSSSQAESESGTSFKRTVEVPEDMSLEALLTLWNPGVPQEKIADLASAVCRWNGLKNSESIRPGLKLLIPSTVPPGKEPTPPAAESSSTRNPAGPAPRPNPSDSGLFRKQGAQAPPAAAQKFSMRSNVAEQRLRKVIEAPMEPRPARPPQAPPRAPAPGSSPAAAPLNQQPQSGMWKHGAGPKTSGSGS